jgi:hypothetical protein
MPDICHKENIALPHIGQENGSALTVAILKAPRQSRGRALRRVGAEASAAVRSPRRFSKCEIEQEVRRPV